MSPAHLVWKACLTVLQIVAICSTLLRLTLRWRMHRLWWDDYVTIIPLVAECFYISSVWIRYSDSNANSGPLVESLALWLSILPFITVLWTSRLSLALGIARIFPNGWCARKCAIAIAAGCCLIWIGCSVQVLTSCLPETVKNCRTKALPKHIAYVGFSTDIAIDLLLVALPLYNLRSINLPTTQRRLIRVAFSASTITLLSALNFTLSVFIGYGRTSSDNNRLISYMAKIEAATSLFVCNAVVLLTWIYRIYRRSDDEETTTIDEASRTPSPRSPRAATDVMFTEISEFHYTEFSAEEYLRNISETYEKSSTHVAPSRIQHSAVP